MAQLLLIHDRQYYAVVIGIKIKSAMIPISEFAEIQKRILQ